MKKFRFGCVKCILMSIATSKYFKPRFLFIVAHGFKILSYLYRFNTKGVVSTYTGTERTSIPHSVGVVACISHPSNQGCNLIRQVQTRIDSQQYISFLQEVLASYPTVETISIVHDKYRSYSFVFITFP